MASSRTAGAIVFLLAAGGPVHAAFSPISGSLTAQTSAVGQQAIATTSNGAPQSLNIISPAPLVEFAVASHTASTIADREFRFTSAASSTIAAPPQGSLALATVNFTQNFTIPARRWLQVTARVNSPPGDPGATASLTLARAGQAPAFVFGHTGPFSVTQEGAFNAGSLNLSAAVNTSVSSPAVGAHSALLDGILRIAAVADFNNDGFVRTSDLATWRAGFGSTSATFATGDVDLDGDADGGDFLLWQRQVGTSAAAAMGTAVPEPGGALLALMAMAAAVGRRAYRTCRSAARRAAASPA